MDLLAFTGNEQGLNDALLPLRKKKGAPRPSPADTVKGTTEGSVDITVAYSQPSIKGWRSST